MGEKACSVDEDEVVYIRVFQRGEGVLIQAPSQEDKAEEDGGCENECE